MNEKQLNRNKYFAQEFHHLRLPCRVHSLAHFVFCKCVLCDVCQTSSFFGSVQGMDHSYHRYARIQPGRFFSILFFYNPVYLSFLFAIFSIRSVAFCLFLLLADSKDTSSAIMQRGVGCPDIDWVSSRTSDDITVCPSGSGRNRLFSLISASEIASHEVSKTSQLTFLPSPNPIFALLDLQQK